MPIHTKMTLRWTIYLLLLLVIIHSVYATESPCFRCGGRKGECLDASRVCDNFIDCPDASDESTAGGGGCAMKKVCEDEATADTESQTKSVILYALVGVVSIESIAIFGVALFVVLRRKPDSTCTHHQCKIRAGTRKTHRPVFSTNVNIYEIGRKNSSEDSRRGPLYIEASGEPAIVTRHPPPPPPSKYSKDVRYFECSPSSDNVTHGSNPPERLYDEIKR